MSGSGNVFNKLFRLTPRGSNGKGNNIDESSKGNKSSYLISEPSNMLHNIHVAKDASTGAITGLPNEWIKWLEGSEISELEKISNPSAVVNALTTYNRNLQKKDEQKFMGTSNSVEDLGAYGGFSKAYSIEDLDKISLNNKLYSSEKGRSLVKFSSTEELNTSNDSPNKFQNSNLNGQNTKLIIKKALDRNKSENVTRNIEDDDFQENSEKKFKSGRSGRRKHSEHELMQILNSIISSENPRAKYKMISKLGSGASGVVFMAHSPCFIYPVAIKKMDLRHQSNRLDQLVGEIEVMRKLKHANIVNYIESFLVSGTTTNSQNIKESKLWIVMEYLEGGSLTDVVTETVMNEIQMAGLTKKMHVRTCFFTFTQNNTPRYEK